MSCKNEISNALIKRLPRYYRSLFTFQRLGIRWVSSKDISVKLGITPSQVRGDFTCFGGEGLQGNGYRVEVLKNKIANFLGLEIPFNMIIIGTGGFSRTLATSKNFEKRGFKTIGIFDLKSDNVGKKLGTFEIMHLDVLPLFIKQQNVDIAIIAVPGIHAVDVIDRVVNIGIKGIWNFSPVEVDVPDDVVIENTYLCDSLMILGYNLKNKKQNATL